MTDQFAVTSLLRELHNHIPAHLSVAERQAVLMGLMSEARDQLDALQSAPRAFSATLEHPQHGIYQIGVDPETLEGTAGSLLDVSLALLTKAVREAASRTIDPRSFDSTADYDRAVERRAATFQIISIAHTAEPIRWFVAGTTASKEAFEIHVEAVDNEDADFQARWQIGLRKHPGVLHQDNVEAFLASLYEITIAKKDPRPVDLIDLAQVSYDLAQLIRSASANQPISDIRSCLQFKALEDMLAKITRSTSHQTAIPVDVATEVNNQELEEVAAVESQEVPTTGFDDLPSPQNDDIPAKGVAPADDAEFEPPFEGVRKQVLIDLP